MHDVKTMSDHCCCRFYHRFYHHFYQNNAKSQLYSYLTDATFDLLNEASCTGILVNISCEEYTCGAPNLQPDGSDSIARVVSGDPGSILSWPWQVSLHYVSILSRIPLPMTSFIYLIESEQIFLARKKGGCSVGIF